MQATVVDFAKDRVIYNITGCTSEELDNKITLFFSSEGYKLKSTNGEVRTFERGNRVLRILLGVWSKYSKMAITIKHQGDLFSVMLMKDSSGMSGGLIGASKMQKEYTRLAEAFKEYFKN